MACKERLPPGSGLLPTRLPLGVGRVLRRRTSSQHSLTVWFEDHFIPSDCSPTDLHAHSEWPPPQQQQQLSECVGWYSKWHLQKTATFSVDTRKALSKRRNVICIFIGQQFVRFLRNISQSKRGTCSRQHVSTQRNGTRYGISEKSCIWRFSCSADAWESVQVFSCRGNIVCRCLPLFWTLIY